MLRTITILDLRNLNLDNAFGFYESSTIASEASYPYRASAGTCQSNYQAAIGQGAVTGFTDVGSEADLLDAVSTVGPISIAIEADQTSFQMYSSGVLTGDCGTSLDHGVLAVGFGTMSGTDYWKVKNSWGASWGANGYVLIERGSDKCGIADGACYPVVDGSVPVPAPTPPSPPTPPPTPPPAPVCTSGCADTQTADYCSQIVGNGWCGFDGNCLCSCACCDDASQCGTGMAAQV